MWTLVVECFEMLPDSLFSRRGHVPLAQQPCEQAPIEAVVTHVLADCLRSRLGVEDHREQQLPLEWRRQHVRAIAELDPMSGIPQGRDVEWGQRVITAMEYRVTEHEDRDLPAHEVQPLGR